MMYHPMGCCQPTWPEMEAAVCLPRLIFSLRQPAIHTDAIYHCYAFIKFTPGKQKFSILALVNTDISSQKLVSDCCKQSKEFYWIKKFFSWMLKVWFPLQLNKTNLPKTLPRHLNFNIWKAVPMTNKLLLNSYEIVFHPLRNHSTTHVKMIIIKKIESEVNSNVLQALIFVV